MAPAAVVGAQKPRQKPWTSLQALALRNGWDAKVTHAHDADWCSVALRAWYPGTGRRVIGLWRGRSLDAMRFTSAMTWAPRVEHFEYFTVLSAAELRECLRVY